MAEARAEGGRTPSLMRRWQRISAAVGVLIVGGAIAVVVSVLAADDARLARRAAFDDATEDLARSVSTTFASATARMAVVAGTLTSTQPANPVLAERVLPAALEGMEGWKDDRTNLFRVFVFTSTVRSWERPEFERIVSDYYSYIPPGNHTISSVSPTGFQLVAAPQPWYIATSVMTVFGDGSGVTTAGLGFNIISTADRRAAISTALAGRRPQSLVVSVVGTGMRTITIFAPVFASRAVANSTDAWRTLDNTTMWYDNATVPLRGVVLGVMDTDTLLRARLSDFGRGKPVLYVVSPGDPAAAVVDPAAGEYATTEGASDPGDVVFGIELVDGEMTGLAPSVARTRAMALAAGGSEKRSFQVELAGQVLAVHVYATEAFMSAEMANVGSVEVAVTVAVTVVAAVVLHVSLEQLALKYQRASLEKQAASIRAAAAKDMFLSVTRFACHELRNPAQVVEATGGLLEETLSRIVRALQRGKSASVGEALRVARHAQRDIQALQDSSSTLGILLAELDNMHTLHTETPHLAVSVCRVREQVQAVSRIAARSARVPIDVSVDAAVPDVVATDAARLFQILSRGFMDAARSAEAGRIVATVTMEAREVRSTTTSGAAPSRLESDAPLVDVTAMLVDASPVDGGVASALVERMFAGEGREDALEELEAALRALEVVRGEDTTAIASRAHAKWRWLARALAHAGYAWSGGRGARVEVPHVVVRIAEPLARRIVSQGSSAFGSFAGQSLTEVDVREVVPVAMGPSATELSLDRRSRGEDVWHAGRWFNSALELTHASSLAQLLGGCITLRESPETAIFELAVPVYPDAETLRHVHSASARIHAAAAAVVAWVAAARGSTHEATVQQLQPGGARGSGMDAAERDGEHEEDAAGGASEPGPAAEEKEAAGEASEPGPAEEAAAPPRRPHVLVVDDERLVQQTLKRLLMRLGWVCTTLPDGVLVEPLLQRLGQLPGGGEGAGDVRAGAAEIARVVQPVDVVLMDIVMLESNGADVCAALRRKGLRLPILAVTSNTSPADLARYRACGFDGVLPKPVTRSVLRTTLPRVLHDPEWVCERLFPSGRTRGTTR